MPDRDLIDAVHDEVYQLLIQRGVEDMTALTDAGQLCDTLQRSFGGYEHYVRAPDKVARNAKIAADLRAGEDPQSLATKHGVTPKTIKRAARRVENDDAGFGSKDWNIE